MISRASFTRYQAAGFEQPAAYLVTNNRSVGAATPLAIRMKEAGKTKNGPRKIKRGLDQRRVLLRITTVKAYGVLNGNE
jgi:hypothetical protein